MKITRTANAGVLLEFQDCSLLIDGVCQELTPYVGTPENIRKGLEITPPDAVLYTHYHNDHYEKGYALNYTNTTLRPVYGPEFAVSGKIKNTSIKAVETAHIGKPDVPHVSYIISGEKCIWMLGDASFEHVKKQGLFPKPQVIILPFAYVISKSAWKWVKELEAEKVIVVHLPKKENDPHRLWKAMEETLGKEIDNLCILDVGETVVIA